MSVVIVRVMNYTIEIIFSILFNDFHVASLHLILLLEFTTGEDLVFISIEKVTDIERSRGMSYFNICIFRVYTYLDFW